MTVVRLFAILIFLSLLTPASADTSRWIGLIENCTTGSKGLNELLITIEGDRVTGFWNAVGGESLKIQEGKWEDGMATWWHRNLSEGRVYKVRVYFSPDGETALGNYWRMDLPPETATRGKVRYQRVERKLEL